MAEEQVTEGGKTRKATVSEPSFQVTEGGKTTSGSILPKLNVVKQVTEGSAAHETRKKPKFPKAPPKKKEQPQPEK